MFKGRKKKITTAVVDRDNIWGLFCVNSRGNNTATRALADRLAEIIFSIFFPPPYYIQSRNKCVFLGKKNNNQGLKSAASARFQTFSKTIRVVIVSAVDPLSVDKFFFKSALVDRFLKRFVRLKYPR